MFESIGCWFNTKRKACYANDSVLSYFEAFGLGALEGFLEASLVVGVVMSATGIGLKIAKVFTK